MAPSATLGVRDVKISLEHHGDGIVTGQDHGSVGALSGAGHQSGRWHVTLALGCRRDDRGKADVTSISPSTVARDLVGPVTIIGSHFVTGATVIGTGGVSFTDVTVISPSRITATIHVSHTATRGSNRQITVTNSDAGGFGTGFGLLLTVT